MPYTALPVSGLYLANPCVLHVALGYGTLWPGEGKQRYLCNPDAALENHHDLDHYFDL